MARNETKEKVNGLTGKPVDLLKGFSVSMRDIISSFTKKVMYSVNEALYRLPEKKRKPVLAVSGIIVFGLLILVVSLLFFNSGEDGKSASINFSAEISIPPEELFMPDEPDFLPGYLLEREPRARWSVEDASPYWKNPDAPEFWRGKIKSAVDTLMEEVP